MLITVATSVFFFSSRRATSSPGADRHDRVAVDDLALLVDDDQPVRVAVERDARGARRASAPPCARFSGWSAPHLWLMFLPSGLDAERDDLGAQLLEHRGRHPVGGAVGAVDDDGQPLERELAREGVLEEDDVAAARVLEPDRAANLGRGGPQVVDRRRWRSAPRSSPSVSSGSLKPSRQKNLMPLSWYGLWEAEITAPASARIEVVMLAMPGVGSGPTSATSTPIEVMPAASACSSM